MSNFGRKYFSFALLLLMFLSVDAEFDIGKKLGKFPLPKSLMPTFYDIKIETINLEKPGEKSNFSGEVTIKALVKEQTQDIVLHCGEFLNCTVTAISIITSNRSNLDFLILKEIKSPKRCQCL